MRTPLSSLVAALTLALCASLVLVYFNARHKGIAIRMGAGGRPALTPPPPAAPPPEALVPPVTNEQLHARLQAETSQLGIRRFVARGERTDDEPRSEGFLGRRLGRPETRAQAETAIREISRLRRSVDADKKKPVPLSGKVVPVLSEPQAGGAAVEAEPAAPAPRPAAPSAPKQTSSAGYWTGLYGGAEEGTLTISDAKAWQSLWARLSRDPVPDVDFARRQVVGVFLGPRPTGGFHVEISTQVTPLPAAVVVRYETTAPAQGHTPPEGGTAPSALRAIEKTSLPVRFEKGR
ncbi:MAG: protease complex subunit PrcB family protein [Elusimicrobia bacterium]|nr:protease complex subunit PrcB family protein [Elusimicrobiota bacterium]